ncbi:MAG: hypothetical protein QNK37_34415 [Acidobacteriota bacterium]|nr:hypothetical protein [Acidobacteriota bacterium]
MCLVALDVVRGEVENFEIGAEVLCEIRDPESPIFLLALRNVGQVTGAHAGQGRFGYCQHPFVSVVGFDVIPKRQGLAQPDLGIRKGLHDGTMASF